MLNNTNEIEIIYNKLVENFPLDSLIDNSKNERQIKDLNRSIYTYGEINYNSYSKIIEKVKL